MKKGLKRSLMLILALFLILLLAFLVFRKKPNIAIINPDGSVICQRFNPPEGFVRVESPEGTFAAFLQNLPLLADKSLVHFYDGSIHFGADFEAVLAYTLLKTNIEQCADVIMHLRAEYLYQKGLYDKIGFHFVSGFYCDFKTWAEGYRPSVNGNDVKWVKSAQPDDSRGSFQNYLEIVYTYASTISLEKELVPVRADELAIGDLFLVAGSPGHVVIVADMAINRETGEKRFLLVQGNMPSQQAHILSNKQDPLNSPWYAAEFPGGYFTAPNGWQCSTDNIKRFAN